MDFPPTPECERMKAVAETSQEIGEFLDWLPQVDRHVFVRVQYRPCRHCQNVYDATPDDPDDVEHCDKIHEPDIEYVLDHTSIQGLLALYFKIDLSKVDDEKRAVLAYLQQEHHGPPTDN